MTEKQWSFCGLPLNVNGRWEEYQLKPELTYDQQEWINLREPQRRMAQFSELLFDFFYNISRINFVADTNWNTEKC